MKYDNLDIYVTGSNSKMLSSDVRTQFRDRGDEIHVNPLSFAEICELYKNKMLAFEHYTIYGEMPYIYSLKNDEEKNQYLKAFIKKIEVYMNAYPRKQLDGKSANEMYQERFA